MRLHWGQKLEGSAITAPQARQTFLFFIASGPNPYCSMPILRIL